MHGLLKVFLLDDLTYRALWAELPHLNSLHEADVVLGEEVRGSWLFCAFKIHKFNSRHHVYAHWQQCLQCLDRIKNKGQTSQEDRDIPSLIFASVSN